MGREVIGRGREQEILRGVLEQALAGPAALLIEGDAGIGKTTLCRAAASAAEEAGFTVLATAGAAPELATAWAGLSDLLGGIEEATLSELSPLHREALTMVSGGLDGPRGNERLIAAAFRTALERCCRQRPVLLLVDDAHWLDEPSRVALGFAVRRLTGAVAVVASYRPGASRAERSWARPPDPQALTRITVGPMDTSDLRRLLRSRLGVELSPRTVKEIGALAAGNPFYALELARVISDRPDPDREPLPPTLTALMRERIGRLDRATEEVAVTVASAFEPTVESVAAATGRSPADLTDILQPMEARGVLEFAGSRILFTHPLIASVIAADADPDLRRATHRRLADVVGHPEQRARHLALGNPGGDPDTLAALDLAAEHASNRGAFSTAAELVTLAINRGGDNHFRRLRGAEFCFRSGALDEAEALLDPVIGELPSGFVRTAGLLLLAAIRGYRDGLARTIDVLDEALLEAGDNPVLRTQALLMLTLATGVSGDLGRCVELARRARDDADASGVGSLRSQAQALWVHFGFMYGLGTDSVALRSALELEDHDADVPVTLQPTAVSAMNSVWTGHLEQARNTMAGVAHRCAERGNDIDVLMSAAVLVTIDIGLGHYAAAEATAAEVRERAEQIGGRLPVIIANTVTAAVAAHRGRLEDTRAAVEIAVGQATAAGLGELVRPPLMSLAFVQVSDGQHEEALQTLKPLLTSFDAAHGTEIVLGAYLPDAVEALTALGRTREAEPFVTALEASGARHDRPWMLAVAERCRAMMMAADGDLDGAVIAAERALKHHDRLPMPFERARTQLVLGQIQRRLRRNRAARESLSRSADVFEQVGSPLWSQRAHRELARLSTRSARTGLTDSERRIAGLAAEGLTNKEIAAALFLSAKTVEMHLSGAYRKLGIDSRTQLAARLREDPTR